MTRPKIKMMQPRIPLAPTYMEARGLKMAPNPWPKKKANKTGRDADPRRTLKLNGGAWQKLRASVLAGEPLCRECVRQGRTTPATDVDHRDGNPGNNDAVNLQPLCHSCHSIKTARDHGKDVRQGCDESGWPADPSHPWNEGTTDRVAALLRPSTSSRARED